MTDSIQGPGLLHVRSRIAQSAKDILDEPTFLKWYDDEHIAEVISTSGIKSGFRYIDVNKTSACGDANNPKPFLAFYPLEKLEFTLGEEFRKIAVQSDNLPGSGIVYDLADLDVSYLGLHSISPQPKTRCGPAKFILTCGLRPDSSVPSTRITSLLDGQRSLVSRESGYLRTVTFKLQYARTNAQSRALKGLPTTDEPCPEPSSWLTMHEFEQRPGDDAVKRVKDDALKMERELGKVEAEVYVWQLERVHGTGEFFVQ